MTTQDVLRQAKELLSDERRWCKKAAARLPDGRATWAADPRAVSWCVVGALDCVAGRACDPALEAVWQIYGGPGISLLNDAPATTHAEVIALLDRALLLVAEQERQEVRGEAVVA